MIRRKQLNEGYETMNGIIQYVTVTIDRNVFLDALIEMLESTLYDYDIEYKRDEDAIAIKTDNTYTWITMSAGYHEGQMQMIHYNRTNNKGNPDNAAYFDFKFECDIESGVIGIKIESSIDRKRTTEFVTDLYDLETMAIEPMLECAGLI